MTTTNLGGTYGSELTSCTVFVCEKRNGLKWYCVDGSINVNATYDEINEGVDVEMLNDVDCFTWSDPINSEEELLNAVRS